MNSIQLSELQQDAITELLNIGMGQAADSLSQMLNDEVKLSLPSFEILAWKEMLHRVDTTPNQKLVIVGQHFEGPFWGDALLLFRREQSLSLVRALMGDEMSEEMLVELEQDALTEVGNVILNACLSSLANVLTHEVISEIPTFNVGFADQIIDEFISPQKEIAVFLRVNFAIHAKNVDGYVAFILEIQSLEKLKENIDKHYLSHLELD